MNILPFFPLKKDIYIQFYAPEFAAGFHKQFKSGVSIRISAIKSNSSVHFFQLVYKDNLMFPMKLL